MEIGEDGRFGALPLHWSDPDWHPFLVRMDGKLAGLVFVKKGPGAVWDMAEFFVLRGFRRSGIGTKAAHEVFRRFPGMWEIRVLEANVSARHFWVGAISKFTGQEIRAVQIEKAGNRWFVYSFSA